MPLHFQAISIPFAQGVDTKTDEKILPHGKLLRLENGVFNKFSRITKRYGLRKVGNGIMGSTSTISSGQGLAKFNNEVALFSANRIYSRDTANDLWLDKGNLTNFLVNNDMVFSNTYSQTKIDLAYNQGLYVFAWKDGRGMVRASVMDSTTGSYIQNDVALGSSSDNPRCLAIGNTIWVFYNETSNLKGQSVTIGNPSAFSTAVTLKSDLKSTEPFFDVTTFGNRAVFAYHKNDSTIHLFFINEQGTVSPTGSPAEATIAERAQNCLTIVNLDDMYVFAGWHNNTNGVRTRGFDSSFNPLFAITTLDADASNNYVNITGAKSASGTIQWFYEMSASASYNQLVKNNTITTAGAAGSTAVFLRSVGLMSKAFVISSVVYVGIVFDSTQQPTHFVANGSAKTVARFNALNAGGLETQHLSSAVVIATNQIAMANTVRARLVTESNTVFYQKSINRTTLDFTNTINIYKSFQLGQNLHVNGSLLWNYDGVNISEHGFNVYPENTTGDATLFALTVTQQGDGTHPEITNITLPAGAAITGGQYFLIDSTTTTFYVWMKVDGVGADPAIGGRTGLQININSTDSANTVASKTATVMDARAELITPQPAAGSSLITNTNAANGAVTDAANGAGNLGIGKGGSVDNGTYGYGVIYQWQDSKNQVHRSFPYLFNVTVSGASANARIGLVVSTLRLTEKSNVIIHIFRTKANQSTYFRLTSATAPLFNDKTVDALAYTDGATDASLLSNEILYTNSGEIGNDAPPSSSFIHNHQNRLWLKSDQRNLLFYSKQYITGRGVEFSQQFSFQIDTPGGDVTGLASVDDKLIVFKRSTIRGIIGEGPNALGQQNDFSQDVLVSTDTGCTEPASIVQFSGSDYQGQAVGGVMFKGDKGIYLLDRSLTLSYIGAPVEAFNSLTITSAVLMEGTNQIRFTTSAGVALVYDYYFGQWSTFTNYQAVTALFQNNSQAAAAYYLLRSDGTVQKETSGVFDDDGNSIKLLLQTAWIKLAGIQGFQRVRRASLLGAFKSSHQFQMDLAYDYNPVVRNTLYWNPASAINTSTWGSDATWGSGAFWGGSQDNVYQFRAHLPRQKVEAISFTISDVINTTYGESFNISDLSLEVGVLPGVYRQRASKSI